ncbi:hypothetical protein GCM10007415_01580 [Parapedobacter pyrenivorans]|uniref:Tachylectin 2 domain-containing protein n=1 Tax=Parapedobacter pyrenivorans TaxID=1305674 RepID=A0A917M3X5_9SPHI|nr:DUF4998 domain-containing protein [Parapedobacter pyrenivorans]GGG73881.1 hypothetical protein GCM10007415_01580 [Parapedobacter pyrenivorans]
MKRKSTNRFVFIALTAAMMIIAGCGKWDDVHQQFVGSGEITYTGKADSISTRGGVNRLELSWLFTSDPKISKYKVYWNNRRDSIIRDFQRATGVDTVRLMLDNMAEGTYHFEIYTFDADGNTSVKAEAIGRVYGSQYQSELLSRAFRASTRFGNDRLLNWIPADESLVRNELIYTDADGTLVEVWIDKTAETTLLENIPLAADFKLRSVFLPEATALDTFYTDFETIAYGYTWLNWNDYRFVFGNHGSLMFVHNNGNLYRSTANTSGDEMNYNLPTQIGNGWTIFETVFTNRNTLIGWYKSIAGVFRYNFDHVNVAFTDQAQIGVGGWDAFDVLFPFQGDVMARLAASPTLYRYGVDAAENFSGVVNEIVGNDPWDQYTLLAASGSNIFGKTADGRLWRIPVTGNTAGTRQLVAENWSNVVAVTVQGDDLLAKTDQGELWQHPVNPAGTLGQPVQIKIPSGEARL